MNPTLDNICSSGLDILHTYVSFYLILTTEQWLEINKKSEAMPDLVLNFAWPLVSWDVVRLKSSEALNKLNKLNKYGRNVAVCVWGFKHIP